MLTPSGPVSRARRPARDRVAQALARRGARERLVLALLLYERLYPIEVASTLGISLRQVERTYDCLLDELRRSSMRANGRAASATPRVRKAA
jgi:DNA-directed RNA polymerase specialized sigma24 family protein